MILVVDPQSNKAKVVQSTDFSAESVRERADIQEWIRLNPALLGENLLVLTIEFDRFDRSNERLDALALDKGGNLVVIEFKRTRDGGAAELQAIRYASMVSSLRMDDLVPYYVDYLAKCCSEQVEVDAAKERISAFVDDPAFAELSNQPRIILCAQDFGVELTTSVFWLRSFGLDISCVRIVPHATPAGLVIVPTKIIPLPEAEGYMVSVRKKEEARQISEEARKEQTFPFLLREGVIKAGDLLYLQENLPNYVVFNSNDPTFVAEVTGQTGRGALQWKKDGQLYSSSNLAKRIFDSMRPEGRALGGVNGSVHWALSKGRDLWRLDSELRR